MVQLFSYPHIPPSVFYIHIEHAQGRMVLELIIERGFHKQTLIHTHTHITGNIQWMIT